MSLRKKGSMPSKSFLAAVAVCVIGASAAAWVSLDQAFSPQTQPQSYQGASSSSRSAASSSSRSQGFSRLEDAATPQSEIAKSSSSSAASSAEDDLPSELPTAVGHLADLPHRIRRLVEPAAPIAVAPALPVYLA